MIDRRRFLGIAAGAGASLALMPELLRALQLQQSSGKLIQRAIPSTGELLPVISFDPAQESDSAGMKEILKVLLDNGGRVIDFPHGGGRRSPGQLPPSSGFRTSCSGRRPCLSRPSTWAPFCPAP